MARGWESKSVEQQMAAEDEKMDGDHHGPMQPQEVARLRQRHSLELSRSRVMHELALAENPKYRKMLEAALADLNSKLEKLSS